MGRRALTDEQEAEVVELYRRGLSMGVIGERYGIAASTVGDAIRRQGHDPRELALRRNLEIRVCAAEGCYEYWASKRSESRIYCSEECRPPSHRNGRPGHRFSERELLLEILRVALLVDEVPTLRHMRQYSVRNRSTYYERGRSWPEWLERAGLPPTRHGDNKSRRELGDRWKRAARKALDEAGVPVV